MKVLFLTHRLPYAPNRGDRIRSYHMLRALQGKADIHLFSLVDADERQHVADLPAWLSSITTAEPPVLWNRTKGLLTLAGSRPLTHTLLDAPGIEGQLARLAKDTHPDVIFAYCSGMARFAVDGPLRHLPCVLDMVDVDSEKWRTLGETASAPWRWIYAREARTLRPFEKRAVGHATTTLVVNLREGQTLESIAPGAPVAVVQNGVDVDFFRPSSPRGSSATVVFCGVMDYEPNIEGVVWFARQVWPRVRMAHPDARFLIVGTNPTKAVDQLAAVPGIEVVGAVPDVRPYLWRAALAVAPLLTARGLQNKVLEALAAGLPVVTTTAVGAGLPAEVLRGCALADDPAAFSDAVSAVLGASVVTRARMAGSVDFSGLTWSDRLQKVPNILAAAAMVGK